MPTYRKDLHLGHEVATTDTDDIVNGAITEEKMADGSVSTRIIQDGAVTEPKLDDGAVSTRIIQDGAVTEPKLADESVSHRTIQDNAVEGNNIKPGSIGHEHLKPDAVHTNNIMDKSVTPAKRSSDFDAKVVLPYVDSIDDKYTNITNELYSLIRSLQVGGIAISQQFGDRTDIGISQKTLTKVLGRLWDELGQITHKTYMDFTLTVQPTFIAKEGAGTVRVKADCSQAISDFDFIQFYVNDVLKAESHDVSVYSADLQISDTSVIKAVGVIMGKSITKQQSVSKVYPFFMGSGQNYQDVMVPECAKTLDGTLEGDYDVTIRHNGDYMFIIIPTSRKEEYRRCKMDMSGIEITFTESEIPDMIICKSVNTFNEGTYNIDIDINS